MDTDFRSDAVGKFFASSQPIPQLSDLKITGFSLPLGLVLLGLSCLETFGLSCV